MFMIRQHTTIECGIEYFAIVECQSSFVDKEVLKVVVVETQRTAVEPYEKRRLGTYEPPITQSGRRVHNVEGVSKLNYTG